jgi:hypothetical protein
VFAPFACMGICRSGARLRDREIETNSRRLPVLPVSPASPVFVALHARAEALLCAGCMVAPVSPASPVFVMLRAGRSAVVCGLHGCRCHRRHRCLWRCARGQRRCCVWAAGLPVLPVLPVSPVFVMLRAGRSAVVCGLTALL